MKIKLTISLGSPVSDESVQLKDSARRVLDILVDEAFAEFQIAIARSINHLSEKMCDRGDKTVYRALEELRSKQFLTKQSCYDKQGQKMENLYLIHAKILDKERLE